MGRVLISEKNGIPVEAAGQNIIIDNDTIYTKTSDPNPNPFATDPYTVTACAYEGPCSFNGFYLSCYFLIFNLSNNQWQLGNLFYYDFETLWSVNATNPSTDQERIPTIGWSSDVSIKPQVIKKTLNGSIKKQNLSTLIPYYIGSDIYPNNLYTFKSATTNLLGTVFNPSLFNSPYADIINITPPNQDQLSLYFDGSEWIYNDFSPNGNNYVIPNNSIIQIQTDNITSVPVGGGAIIQKYYSGKITIPIAGIPVSSTNTITINDSYQNLTDIVLTKINATTYKANADFTIGQYFCDTEERGYFTDINVVEIVLFKEGSSWIYKYACVLDCPVINNLDFIIATIQEQTPGYIPTKGWVLENGINGTFTISAE
jgi:hypothetical protein